MKKWIKALLSGLVATALTVSMLAYLTGLVEQKESYQYYGSFYEQEEPFDVLFLGTSHTRYAVIPMDLWKDYGIVSYNMAIQGAYMPTIYWTMMDHLERAKPKLVVIDCYYLHMDEKGCNAIGETHVALDALPLDRNKFSAIKDTFGGTGQELEFVWDFVLYHDRWNKLTRNDFVPEMAPTKGCGLGFEITEVPEIGMIDASNVMEEDTLGVIYLRKMIEECQARNIDVLLTYIPYLPDEIGQKEANRAALIAEEYGIDYINYLQKNLIEYNVDLNDMEWSPMGTNGHLNFSGAGKLTDHLGDYIVSNYDIPDRRSDPAYADWYDDLAAYKQNKIDIFNVQQTLTAALVQCSDKHFSYYIYLTEDILQMNDKALTLQLQNVGVDPAALLYGPVVAVIDNVTGNVSYLNLGDLADTSFGQVSLAQTDGGCDILLNGGQAVTVQPEADVAITIIDNDTGGVVLSDKFVLSDISVNRIG